MKRGTVLIAVMAVLVLRDLRRHSLDPVEKVIVLSTVIAVAVLLTRPSLLAQLRRRWWWWWWGGPWRGRRR